MAEKQRQAKQMILRRRTNSGQNHAQMQENNLLHTAALDIYSEPLNFRKSSIICTIGPNTNNIESLVNLTKAGLSVCRLNFSHGSHEYHAGVISNMREAVKLVPGITVAIALDTKGPEIRTGNLECEEDVLLEKGKNITVTVDNSWKDKCSQHMLYVDYANITKVMTVGDNIFVDDGLISLEVQSISHPNMVCVIKNSGKLGGRKGVNLPNVNVDLPALSEKDLADLAFGVEQGVDMIFASFIRKASDVEEVRNALGEKGKHIKIISKIENHEGVRNFDDILEATDGVMVARGDLGIEILPEKVFLAQKMMISKCNIHGKPVICATQMLESMTVNPRPTRAEVSDVANAILDGADCVMLSGETAKGIYPVEAVTVMANIVREAESAIFYRPMFTDISRAMQHPTSTPETVALAAVNASREQNCAALIVLTTSGDTARLVSKYRPSCPIITVTRDAATSRQVHLYRGCYPLYYETPRGEGEWQEDVENRIKWAIELGKERLDLESGDTVVAIQGWMRGGGYTNTMRILVV